MKKLLLTVSAACLLLAAGIKTTVAEPFTRPQQRNQELNWVKSRTGVWLALVDNKINWFKLDKNARLWASADGKEWLEITDGMWLDKDGRQLKIGEGKLWSTSDEGKNFMEVPEWKWKGPKGEWYKFDAKWTLWVVK
ncbi:hypothetical protein [Chitinophaga barathri]|uniref:WWE domain-containing protein n=1 Tax=Chitinophaga barathri TaxID=1647451 RepID=A0A3N4MFT8_9BACT|nr:hypothetical protein [Chitinophaga barathri]RPD42701.1 hypothetical protein EG028_04605 [Chitinophaga barathri]